jgi:hypothetical protein
MKWIALKTIALCAIGFACVACLAETADSEDSEERVAETQDELRPAEVCAGMYADCVVGCNGAPGECRNICISGYASCARNWP